MKKIAITLSLCLLLNACKQDALDPSIKTPKNCKIDIENDGVNDFEIIYSLSTRENAGMTEKRIEGKLLPLANTFYLMSPHLVGLPVLFLAAGDSINRISSQDTIRGRIWGSYTNTVIGINGINDSWDDNWLVVSASETNNYNAFKLIRKNKTKIGYMKLDFDTKTGEIKVLDSKLTTDDFLIIE